MLQMKLPVFLKPVILLLHDKVLLRLWVFLGTMPKIILELLLSQNGKDMAGNCCGLFEGTTCHFFLQN
jgi:hypothetical protein